MYTVWWLRLWFISRTLVINHRHVLRIGLEQCRKNNVLKVAKILSGCQVVILSYRHVVKLRQFSKSNVLKAATYYHLNVILSFDNIFILSYCYNNIAIFSFWFIFLLSYCQVVILSYRHVVKLRQFRKSNVLKVAKYYHSIKYCHTLILCKYWLLWRWIRGYMSLPKKTSWPSLRIQYVFFGSAIWPRIHRHL